MAQESKSQKKVDYRIMSNQVCKVCGKPLKQNIVNKGFSLCYVCFKLAKGKKYSHKKGKKIDFIQLQKQNTKNYKGRVE